MKYLCGCESVGEVQPDRCTFHDQPTQETATCIEIPINLKLGENDLTLLREMLIKVAATWIEKYYMPDIKTPKTREYRAVGEIKMGEPVALSPRMPMPTEVEFYVKHEDTPNLPAFPESDEVVRLMHTPQCGICAKDIVAGQPAFRAKPSDQWLGWAHVTCLPERYIAAVDYAMLVGGVRPISIEEIADRKEEDELYEMTKQPWKEYW